jgi:hypothetical protein
MCWGKQLSYQSGTVESSARCCTCLSGCSACVFCFVVRGLPSTLHAPAVSTCTVWPARQPLQPTSAPCPFQPAIAVTAPLAMCRSQAMVRTSWSLHTTKGLFKTHFMLRIHQPPPPPGAISVTLNTCPITVLLSLGRSQPAVRTSWSLLTTKGPSSAQ